MIPTIRQSFKFTSHPSGELKKNLITILSIKRSVGFKKDVVLLPSFSKIYRALPSSLTMNSRQIKLGNFYSCCVTVARKFNPNAEIEWAVLLLHIRGMSLSNFGSVTNNPHKGFRCLFQSLLINSVLLPQIRPRQRPSQNFQFIMLPAFVATLCNILINLLNISQINKYVNRHIDFYIRAK
jgi:hypothetical protein